MDMDLGILFCPTFFIAEAVNWFHLLDRAVRQRREAAVKQELQTTERRYETYIAKYPLMGMEFGSLLGEEINLADEDARVSLAASIQKVAALHSWKKRLDGQFVDLVRRTYPPPDTLALERELSERREAQSAVRTTLVELGMQIKDVLEPLIRKHEMGFLMPRDIHLAKTLIAMLKHHYHDRSSLVP